MISGSSKWLQTPRWLSMRPFNAPVTRRGVLRSVLRKRSITLNSVSGWSEERTCIEDFFAFRPFNWTTKTEVCRRTRVWPPWRRKLYPLRTIEILLKCLLVTQNKSIQIRRITKKIASSILIRDQRLFLVLRNVGCVKQEAFSVWSFDSPAWHAEGQCQVMSDQANQN